MLLNANVYKLSTIISRSEKWALQTEDIYYNGDIISVRRGSGRGIGF